MMLGLTKKYAPYLIVALAAFLTGRYLIKGTLEKEYDRQLEESRVSMHTQFKDAFEASLKEKEEAFNKQLQEATSKNQQIDERIERRKDGTEVIVRKTKTTETTKTTEVVEKTTNEKTEQIRKQTEHEETKTVEVTKDTAKVTEKHTPPAAFRVYGMVAYDDITRPAERSYEYGGGVSYNVAWAFAGPYMTYRPKDTSVALGLQIGVEF